MDELGTHLHQELMLLIGRDTHSLAGASVIGCALNVVLLDRTKTG